MHQQKLPTPVAQHQPTAVAQQQTLQDTRIQQCNTPVLPCVHTRVETPLVTPPPPQNPQTETMRTPVPA
eukprot:13230574-Ditylum_brightwellii.AAC.1